MYIQDSYPWPKVRQPRTKRQKRQDRREDGYAGIIHVLNCDSKSTSIDLYNTMTTLYPIIMYTITYSRASDRLCGSSETWRKYLTSIDIDSRRGDVSLNGTHFLRIVIGRFKIRR